MSEMQFFHGYFEKSDLKIEPEDNDDFYDLEEKHGCYYVKVDGHLYSFIGSGLEFDAYGFSGVLPPTDKNQIICLWYNGGAGIHEVVEDAIQKHLSENKPTP